MELERTTELDHPLDEVWAWHTRPGAMARLFPPWLPLKVAREATSLSDGTAVLRTPVPGLDWVAAHDPTAYQEGHRFADELATPGLRTVLRWRHTHLFDPAPGSGSRITDHLDTTVPGWARRSLEETLAYRGRQLTGDLAAHAHLASLPGSPRRPLTVAVTGASGLVGTALTAFLSTGGHQVIRLVRRPDAGNGHPLPARRWDPEHPDPRLLDGVDALVHLAGAPIAGRFTDQHKKRVYDSRVLPTRRLAELVAGSEVQVLVSASAVGYYGPDRGDEPLDEQAGRGDGFLAGLVEDWERATDPARNGSARVVQIRTGLVHSPAGGLLQPLRLLFSAGLGGRLGSGTQWMPWIGIDDLLDVYLRALLDARLQGPVNAVAPNPVTNKAWTETLARVLHRPALFPVPEFAPALLLGREGASEFALAGQHALPAALRLVDHRFRFPDLEPALRHLLGRSL